MSRTLLKVPVNAADHYRGEFDASISLLEYGDFQCPFSAMQFTELERVLDEFEGDVLFAYRHFPLRHMHPYAELAALAAEAAALQGRFWSMHHLLYLHYDSLSENTLLLLAEEVKLDMDRFVEDMKSPLLLERVQMDFMSGVRSAVKSTPALFLNGWQVEGSLRHPSLRQLILDGLEQAALHKIV